MKRFISCSALALLCGTLSAPLVIAQSTAAKPAADTKQDSSNANDAGKSEQHVDATIAKLGERVDLTAEQKGKIKSVVSTGQAEISSTWAKFKDAHVKMVSLEAEMVAAMDDILEPKQQQKVEAKRQEKEQSATATKSAESTTADKNAKKTSDASQQKGVTSSAKTQPNKEGAKTSSSQVTDSDKIPATDSNRDGKTDADETIVWTMVIVPVQDVYSVCEMSDAQTMQCDEVCQSYHKELVQLHREIRSLHEQLVRLEAKEINQIEAALTSEQITQLRTARKKASPAKISANSNTKNTR